MGIKLYIGNLSYNVQSNDLTELFEQYGAVTSAQVIVDRETGRSKGFGFVEMSDSANGNQAITAVDGKDFQGRNIKVTEAKPQEKRSAKSITESFGFGTRGNKRW